MPSKCLVLFRLAQCPERIFQQGWQTLGHYFNIAWFLKEHAQCRFSKSTWAVMLDFQAENSSVLNSQLTSLQTLQKTFVKSE
jgi:hypothetical protein